MQHVDAEGGEPAGKMELLPGQAADARALKVFDTPVAVPRDDGVEGGVPGEERVAVAAVSLRQGAD